jgi:hypothetical protein
MDLPYTMQVGRVASQMAAASSEGSGEVGGGSKVWR